MASDLAVSLGAYAALVAAAGGFVFLIGKMFRGRGRVVLLAFGLLVLAAGVQVLLSLEEQLRLQLCILNWCWQSLLQWVNAGLAAVPWAPTWLDKFSAAALANALFLIIGPIAVLMVASLSTRLRGSEPLDDESDRKHRLRVPLLGRPSCTLYASLFAASAMIGFCIVAFVTYNPGTILGRDVAEVLGRLIWAGPILCFGLLCGASRAVEVPERASAVRRVEAPQASRSLGDLIESYRAEYEDVLLHWDHVRRDVPVGPEPDRDPGTLIGRVIEAARSVGYTQLDDLRQTLDVVLSDLRNDPAPGRQKPCPVFAESLTFLHFILFAELILSCQDRGGTTLLLAPETSLERIEEQLRHALSVHFAGHTQRIWSRSRQPDRMYDILIVSPERIEAEVLSRDDNSIRDALERLGLVLILDYQNIDPSLLRIRLARLRRVIGERALDVLCQSEPRAGLRTKVAETISALVRLDPRPLSIGGRGNVDRFWLFWRNDRRTLEKMLEREVGVGHIEPSHELVPLTLVRAIQKGFDATFYDPYGRAYREPWARLQAFVNLPNKLIGHMESGWSRFPGVEDQVVVIEDLNNLVVAARMNMNFMHNPECLTHVVSQNYPMREFLRDVLKREAEQARRHQEGWSGLGQLYLPIAPNPSGGPTELAMDLASEFIHSGRLKQREIEARFGEIVPGGVADSLEIAPTERGLEKLFELQRGFRPEIIAHDVLGHEQEFEVKIQGRLHLEPSFLLPVYVPGQDDPITYVDRQDEGLTFVRGTMLQVGGDFYEVSDVTDIKMDARLSDFSLGHRPLYRFERQYMVPFRSKTTFIEGNPDIPADMARWVYELRLLLRGTFERHTVAKADALEFEVNLWADDGRWDSADSERRSSHNASIMLVRLALAESHPQATKLDGDAFGRLAFTLAATLQDVLASLLPSLAPRIAVLSPQAAPAISQVLTMAGKTAAEPIDLFPVHLYPRLVGEHFEVAERTGDTTSDLERRLYEDRFRFPAPAELMRKAIDDYLRNALPPGKLFPLLSKLLLDGAPGRVIDLIIVEDASHDRGGVRALFEEANWNNVVKVWAEFVEWTAKNAGEPWLYYRFGSDRLPAVFAFEEAREFLHVLAEGRGGLRRPKEAPVGQTA